MRQVFFCICVIAVIFTGCDYNKNDSKRLALLFAIPPMPAPSVHDWVLMNSVSTAAPSSTVKLMFIHHSTGSAWIATGTGNLGAQLNANNYYVTESDYGWGPASSHYTSGVIGDHTDTGDWPNWFFDSTVMDAVYTNISHFDYPANTMANPLGENTIIMFKSCFPCSEVGGSIDDEKSIYNSLLDYFATRTDKMFMLIVPPPEIEIDSAPLTRELANWLVHDLVAEYNSSHDPDLYNVYVFDYYNVLTDPNNHHWVVGTDVHHVITANPSHPYSPDELYYPTGDSHPSAEGHQKATNEFVPYLNACYNNWQSH